MNDDEGNPFKGKFDDTLDFSDASMGQHLVNYHGEDFAYVYDGDAHLAWDESAGFWFKEPKTAKMRDLYYQVTDRFIRRASVIRRLARDQAREAGVSDTDGKVEDDKKDDADTKEAKAALKRELKRADDLEKWATTARQGGHTREGIRAAIEHPAVRTLNRQWDQRPDLLTIGNGTFELGAGAALREHRREDRLTCGTDTHYVADARSEEWEAFLEHVVPDREARAFLQKLAGYSMYGDNHLRLLIILLGETSSGKTTLAEIIRAVLGNHAASFKLSLFIGKQTDAPRPDVLAAMSKRFIFASESSPRWRLHAEEINNMVGNEHISARGMSSDHMIDQKPRCTPWLTCNRAPTILDADQALWERLIVVPCGDKISTAQRDPSLVHRLSTDHGEAVLAWLVEGWNAYQREGLADPPYAVVEATMALREGLSVLDHWIADKTERADDYKTTSRDLWSAYSNWLDSARIAPEDRLSEVGFGRALGDRGYTKVWLGSEGKRQRGRGGLRLRQDADSLI